MDGDTVLVADGTYTGDGNRDIDFYGKAIVVMSENGPEATIIDCQADSLDSHRGFQFYSEEGPSSVVRGFTIRNGYACGEFPQTCGGAIHCLESSPTIADNVIRGNTAQIDGGGIACEYQSSPIIVGNTITGNMASRGGGILCWLEAPAMLIGNTITGNEAAYGGGIGCYSVFPPTVVNSIIWGNNAGTGPEIYAAGGYPVEVTYCDVAGGWAWGSPCIDAGHPDSLDPDGTRSDMGAHFFDQDDYLTLYLTPDAREVSPGGTFGVTYTAINRWAEPEPFWVLTEAVLPGGDTLDVMGPDAYTLPADFTVQRHFTHSVPLGAPSGRYSYQSRIGVPPSTLYEDSFQFEVLEVVE
ncbi:hypothetical protein AMJ82_10435 [candidate division TA06 bacterium SM23_40]|uniref:Right handed beta helix domain-containing protein n=1 Tax=candidate division TA06 bacterium SM23_40 TaxID=1703774 RepID=A0A0S8G5P3_UNCT6|nr:MAG: hypothetical protein AMJ82_10435 [candidate division TA06 bacterium SM23_40]